LLNTRILDQPIITNEKYTFKPFDPFRTLKVNSRTYLHIEQTKNERKTRIKLYFYSKVKQSNTVQITEKLIKPI